MSVDGFWIQAAVDSYMWVVQTCIMVYQDGVYLGQAYYNGNLVMKEEE